MDWVVLEVIHDAGARLEGLRLSDGLRHVLFECEHAMPLHAAVNPAGTRVAVDAVVHSTLRGRHRSRLGLVNLERLGIGWTSPSLDPKWHLSHACFDDSGRRLAYEGAFDGVPISDIYVEDVQISGNSVRGTVVAGAGNPQKLGCARPVFLPGGDQLLYLRNTRPDGAWELCLLDLDRSGDSAWQLEGRAPSVLSLTLTEGAEVVPDVPVVYCPPLKTAFWAGKTRGGTRQVLRAVKLGDRAHRDLGRAHLRIDEICVAPEGELIAYAADGQLWLADSETGSAVSLSAGEPEGSHRGLTFDLAGGRLLLCTSDAEGARVRAIHLADRRGEVLHTLGDVSVLSLSPLPDSLKVDARMSALLSEASPTAPTEETPTMVDAALNPALVAELTAAAGARAAHLPAATALEVSPVSALAELTGEPEASAPEAAEPEAAEPEASAPEAAEPEAAEPEASAPEAAEPEPAEPEASAPEAAEPEPAEPEVAEPETSAPEAAEPETPTAADPLPAVTVDLGIDPADDFTGWMKRVSASADPGAALRSLTTRQADTAVREGARLYLGTQRRRAAGRDEPPPSLMFALAAAAHLQLDEARRDLVALCERARPRVERGRLPGVEEHFALAALEHLNGTRPDFHAAEVFGEHADIEGQRAMLVASEGEGAAARYVDAHARQYLNRLRAAMRRPTPPLGSPAVAVTPVPTSLVDLAADATARQHAERAEAAGAADTQDLDAPGLADTLSRPPPAQAPELAEAETAPPPGSTPPNPVADPVAAAAAALEALASELPDDPIAQERAEIARLDAERREAALAVEAAERQRAADEAAAHAARMAAEAQAAADAEWQAARAAAEQASAQAAAQEAAAEAEWQAARAAAEAQAQSAQDALSQDIARKAEAAKAAAAAAAAQVAQAERAMAEAERAREAAEAALAGSTAPPPAGGPEAQPRIATPLAAAPADPAADRRRAFSPLTGPLPAMPSQARATGSLPVQRAPADVTSAFTPSADLPLDEAPEAAIGLPSGRGRPPLLVTLAGIGAVAGGLSQMIVSAKVGGGFLPLGALWLLGGLGLLADRRLGFFAGLASFAANAGWLAYVALQPVPAAHLTQVAFPAWMPRSLFWLGAAAAAALLLALLTPPIAGRYRRHGSPF